jgi:septum formation protein
MAEKLILASASASRKNLLAGACLDFEAYAADVDERAIESRLQGEHAAPDRVALTLAAAKAVDVSNRHPDRYVIGSDQVLSLGARIFHKPKTMEEAGSHIMAFSGKTHHLNCGVAIARGGEILWQKVSVAAMHVRKISPNFLAHYLAMAGPDILQSVGAYQFEGAGVQLFEKIEGDYFTILGLPLIDLLAGLRKLGAIDG